MEKLPVATNIINTIKNTIGIKAAIIFITKQKLDINLHVLLLLLYELMMNENIA